jgi:hypothetical protein
MLAAAKEGRQITNRSAFRLHRKRPGIARGNAFGLLFASCFTGGPSKIIEGAAHAA